MIGVGVHKMDLAEFHCEIAVGRDYVALVDLSDYPLLSQYRWHPLRRHGRAGAYAYAWIGGIHVYMHRLVAKTPAGTETDHINGNGLDNRKANLRFATSAQNKANRLKRDSSATSRYKGVSWSAQRGKWLACIGIDGRGHNLGRYADEADAARAYDAAALCAWGEFAQLNFPDGLVSR